MNPSISSPQAIESKRDLENATFDVVEPEEKRARLEEPAFDGEAALSFGDENVDSVEDPDGDLEGEGSLDEIFGAETIPMSPVLSLSI